MILQNINKIPFIHLGFNKQSGVVDLDAELIIYQTEIYVKNGYTLAVIADDLTLVESGFNRMVVSFDVSGIKPLYITATHKIKGTILTSNTININVYVYASSNTIKASSNVILASG